MLVDVDGGGGGGGGGDGIETKPITSLDGRRLCFVIYPRGWSVEGGSGIGCVDSAIGICAT